MPSTVEQQRQELRNRIARLRRRIDGELRGAAQPALAMRQAGTWFWLGRTVVAFGVALLAKHRGDLAPAFKSVWRFCRNVLRPARKRTTPEREEG